MVPFLGSIEGNSIELFGTIDLENKKITSRISTDKGVELPTALKSVDFPAGLTFDSSTRIEICSSSTTMHYQCEVQKFIIWPFFIEDVNHQNKNLLPDFAEKISRLLPGPVEDLGLGNPTTLNTDKGNSGGPNPPPDSDPQDPDSDSEEDPTNNPPPVLSVATENAIVTSQTASTAASQVMSALTAGSSMGLSTSIASKIFSNIKYLNITWSADLEVALATWKSGFFSFDSKLDPFHIEENVAERPIPYVFEKYEIPSSFILNFLETLWLLLILGLIHGLSRIFEWAVRNKNETVWVKVFRGFRILTQNYLLTQLYNIYGDLVLYAIIEYRSIDFGVGLTWLSFTCSGILITLMTVCFVLHLRFLMKYQRIRKESKKNKSEQLEEFIQSNQGNQVLFDDFKDDSLMQQAFLMFLTLRDVGFSVILSTMFKHSLIQSILILVLNLAMIFYLVFKTPFKKHFGLVQMLFYETIFLAVNINVLVLAFLDDNGPSVQDTRDKLGQTIIILNLVFNIASLIILVVGLFLIAKDFYDAYKLKRQQKQKTAKVLPVSSTSIDMSYSTNNSAMNLKGLNTLKSQLDAKETSMTGRGKESDSSMMMESSEKRAKKFVPKKVAVLNEEISFAKTPGQFTLSPAFNQLESGKNKRRKVRRFEEEPQEKNYKEPNVSAQFDLSHNTFDQNISSDLNDFDRMNFRSSLHMVHNKPN